jgi:two-component system chemotaxis sensor kinase CheA
MAVQGEELLKRLLQTFAIEAEEHLGAISAGLLALEQQPSETRRRELVEATFREVHTLKGAARAVNLVQAVELCHALETIFAILKQSGDELSAELLDLLHESFALVKAILPGGEGGPEDPRTVQAALMTRLTQAGEQLRGAPDPDEVPVAAVPTREEAMPAPAFTARPGLMKETIRLPVAKLDAVLLQAEEMAVAKLAVAQQAAELTVLRTELEELLRSRMRGRLRSVAGLGASLPDADDPEARIYRRLAGKVAGLADVAKREARGFGKMLDNLLETTKQLMMVPFSALLDPLPQLVRDLARAQGKEADLSVTGDDLEIDRRIQDEMKDALLHLVRNAMDHGIERGEDRRAKGKPARGRITVAVAQHDSGKAEIVISDDGAGIDAERVLRAARQLGLAEAEDVPANDEGALPLVFRSGLSTSPVLTEVSGRGLGLAIVREKVEKLGGAIAVSSVLGQGTEFRIVLPLVLASFRGILVEAGGMGFVLPTRHVERVARVPVSDIGTIENRETVRLGARTLGLVWLRDILDLPGEADAHATHRQIAVLNWAGTAIAFVVDAVLEEREVLMKGLGRQLANVPHLAGATLLPTGGSALILDVPDLMRSAISAKAPVRVAAATPERKSILVAEDSITARTLIKHVLEAAGYRVKTAVDGADAWMSLGDEKFHLVVSDVEMPKLGGFELTAKIRADPKLAALPVILVTSLGSREDRERGIDAGANAYIVKDSFDQSALLRLVGHLI